MRPNRSLVAACALAVLLSGCSNASNGPGGQAASGGGNLAYNGASDATQTDTFESDGSCKLAYSANLGSGKVVFSITGGGGSTSVEVKGPSQASDDDGGRVSGSAGTWTLKAVRSGGFTGQYAATAEC